MLVWLMIYLSNGFFPKEYISGYYRAAIMLFFIVLVALRKRKTKINKSVSMGLLVFALLQMISIVINGLSIQFDLYHLGMMGVAAAFVCVIDENEFIKEFRQGLLYVCIGSFLLYWIGFWGLLSYLPKVLLIQSLNTENVYTVLGIFNVQFMQKYTYYRNFGIFSEPGQYQIYICVGIFFELFAVEKKDIRRLFVYVLTLITCNSTNGFVTAFLVILTFFIDKRKNENKDTKKIRIWLSGTIIICGILLVIFGSQIDVVIEAINKITEFLYKDYSATDIGTGIERRRAIQTAIDCFFMNPVVGLSYKGLHTYLASLSSETYIMTCSPINWFAYFGFLYGILANLAYLIFYLKYPKQFLAKAMILLAVISMISAQAVNSDAMTWILIFYSIKKFKINKVNYQLLSSEIYSKTTGV